MADRKISDLPEHTRRTILRTSVAAITLAIVVAWFWWLPNTLSQIKTDTKSGQENTELENARQQLADTLKQLRGAEEPVSEEQPPSDDQIIQAMKDKLTNQQTASSTTATTTPSSTPAN